MKGSAEVVWWVELQWLVEAWWNGGGRVEGGKILKRLNNLTVVVEL